LFKNRRSDLDIICHILELASDGARKTEILYQGNFSYTQLKHYMPLLIKNNILEEQLLKDDGSSYKMYKTTNKGHALLKDIEKVLSNFK